MNPAHGSRSGTEMSDLIVSPGPGWGDGSHETTRLCLQAVRLLAPRGRPSWRALDFGSGSGLLAITAAKLGATVDAVEIDEAGLAHGERNAALNEVGGRVGFSRTLEGQAGPYELVVANILRPVLVDFAQELTRRLSTDGILILSGLVATDLPEIGVRYGSLLEGRMPEVYRRGDWRAAVWRK